MPEITITLDDDDVGRLLAVWRVEASVALKDAAAMASARLPYSISWMTVSRLETPGDAPKEPDPLVVAALTLAYGHSLGELPKETRAQLATVGKLVKCLHT